MSKHLAKGDPLPKLSDEKATVFSMLFCPYAQRVRLILDLKGIAHEVVNVNLRNKPGWLLDLNPKGQVPILHYNGQIICGSLEICKYLDQQFPNPSLFRGFTIEDETLLKNNLEPFITIYYDAVWKRNGKTFREHISDMTPHIKMLEHLLKQRGKFFGGDSAIFTDFMIWPWVERLGVLELTFAEKLPLDEFPVLVTWSQNMQNIECVKNVFIDPMRHFKATQFHFDSPANYDSV